VQTSATELPGVYVVETSTISDSRGNFARLFCDRALEQILGGRRIVQINHSLTRSVGAVRGLHFQHPPHAEMKLVRCLRGRVWDVALDTQPDSPTYLRWSATELSAENRRMLVIPEGFAHGFQVLEADSELLYLHTAHYQPDAEDGIRYDDPLANIPWPLPIRDVSPRDANLRRAEGRVR
jgi:dTDP-4-dehydrorhamnose 3,5-epimerase